MLGRMSLRLALLSVVVLIASRSAAYQWPLKQFGSVHRVIGTVGEYRIGDDRIPNTGDDHLHRGVDVDGDVSQAVYPVVDGTVSKSQGDYVWVEDGSRIIEYRHLTPSVGESQQVTAGITVLGAINGQGHVHLVEDAGAVNPLRSGGLTPYTDSSSPVVLSIEVVKDGTPGGGSPFPDTLGCPKVQGRADIKVTARDPQSSGSLKTAPYKIGYEIRNEDGAIVDPALYKIRFDTVDGYSLSLVYSETESNETTFVYWATNRPNANEYWDSETVVDGWYWIYAYAEDIAGNGSLGGSKVLATDQLKVWVDGNIAARLVGEWAYRSGSGVVVAWNAEVERNTAGYVVEGKQDGAWYEVGKTARADALAPGVYTVAVDEECDRYRVVEVDSLGHRQEFKSFGVSDAPPSYLDNLVGNAQSGDVHAQAGLACCLKGSDAIGKAVAAATETVPDWVFYGPDSLLDECAPAVSWFEEKGKEVALVTASTPDH